jgi:hypothetical protein
LTWLRAAMMLSLVSRSAMPGQSFLSSRGWQRRG